MSTTKTADVAVNDFVSVQIAAAETGATAAFIRRQIRAELLPITKGKVRVSDVRAAHAANSERISARQAMHDDARPAIGPKARKIEIVRVDAIAVLAGRRPINLAAVKALSESIRRIGLQSPIGVRYSGNICELVVGHHRLAAAKMLAWETIEAFSIDGDDVATRLAEIAENLHRAELTKLERDEQVAEWIKLTDGVSSDAETKPISDAPQPETHEPLLSQVATAKTGRGGHNEGGVNAAARELGIDRDDAHRAVKVASLSDEAKQAARDVGLDDNRSALLAAARETEPAKQVEVLVNRRPVDRAKLDRDLRLRAISEISLLINDHVPPDMRIAIRKNFEVLGSADGKAIAEAIAKVEARRR